MPPGVDGRDRPRRRGPRPAARRPETGGVGARAGRRQHHLDPAARRALRAVRPQPGGRCSSSTRSPTRCCRSSRRSSPRSSQLGCCGSSPAAADVGAYLVHHRGVDHVHITGSAATHDAIVFGTGEDGRAAQGPETPTAADKPITSELGGVSPIIVRARQLVDGRPALPGRARGHPAPAQRRLQLHRRPGRRSSAPTGRRGSEFLAALRRRWTRRPARPAYYPGSDDRVAAARRGLPAAEAARARRRPPARRRRPPTSRRDALLRPSISRRCWASSSCPGTGQAFLDAAVGTANDDFVGTLGVNVIIDPRDAAARSGRLRRGARRLRYGTHRRQRLDRRRLPDRRGDLGRVPRPHASTTCRAASASCTTRCCWTDPERTVRPRTVPAVPALARCTASSRCLAASRRGSSPTAPRQPPARLTAFAARPGWARLPGIFASALRG